MNIYTILVQLLSRLGFEESESFLFKRFYQSLKSKIIDFICLDLQTQNLYKRKIPNSED